VVSSFEVYIQYRCFGVCQFNNYSKLRLKMEKFLTGKSRKYGESYVSLAFTSVCVGDKERRQCVLRQKTLC
jgi:hypothetical protein